MPQNMNIYNRLLVKYGCIHIDIYSYLAFFCLGSLAQLWYITSRPNPCDKISYTDGRKQLTSYLIGQPCNHALVEWTYRKKTMVWFQVCHDLLKIISSCEYLARSFLLKVILSWDEYLITGFMNGMFWRNTEHSTANPTTHQNITVTS